MQPFDYTPQGANPFQSAMQGFQFGAGIRDNQLQQQQQEMAMRAEQAKMQQQQQMQSDLSALSANPRASGADYAAVMTKYPSLSKQLGESWGALNTAQQQSKLQEGTQAYAAIMAGKTDLAESMFRERATAARNSGSEAEARQAETMADLIKQNPETARTSIALSLSSHMGPEKFADTFAKLGGENRATSQEARTAELHPLEMRQKAATAAGAEQDVTTKTVAAKFAESKAVQDLKLGESTIAKMAADTEIARRNSQIAAQHAAIARESNSIKRQEMQINLQEKIDKRDDKVREKYGAAQSGAASIDNMLNTIQRVQQNKSLDRVIGVVDGRVPGMTEEQADAIALIETLGSQAFMAQIPNLKGMGALSNAEGEKLQASLQNLTRVQSPAQFRTSLNEATRIMTKARENLAKTTGIDLGKPDTPAAPGARPPLSSFQR